MDFANTIKQQPANSGKQCTAVASATSTHAANKGYWLGFWFAFSKP